MELPPELCFRYTDSTIPLLPKYEISSVRPSSVVVQPGLCRTWSETPKRPAFSQRGSYNIGSVRGSPNDTIGNITNGTIGSQWNHWLTNGTNSNIGRANGTIGITIGINGITNGTIGITLNNIGIPLVPLVEP